MAKRDETGELLSKPTKPPRRFPWRLWLFAILMTAGTGAGGYFTWDYRQDALAAREQQQLEGKERAACDAKLSNLITTASADKVRADACMTAFDGSSKKGKELESQLDASKEELTTLRAQRAEAEKRLKAIEEFQQQFSKMIGAGQLKLSARRGSLVLSLPSEVLFASGRAEVSEQGTLAVLEIGITLKKLKDRRFLVLGHTDDVPLKGSQYKDNWELSTARALNVTRTLVKAGMNPENLIPAGAGPHDPLSKERARNRRIEIALLPAIDELPPLPKSLSADADRADKKK